MSDLEKAMAFQQNKTALALANLDQKARILTLADCLDLMLTAKSSLADWGRKLHRNWANFANLSILSWHGANGAQVNNTATATDPAILLPVQNGAANACPSLGVIFVRVQLALDYANLNRINPMPNTTLCGEYYIQLPQDSVDLQNAAGNTYHLTTFTGAADLRTLSINDIRRDILGATHLDGPFNLPEPSFNLTSCRTDSMVIYGELKSQVVRLASDTIHQQLFKVLVPGYLMEPHNVLYHIWQSVVDQEGTHIRLNTQVYYTTFLNAICSFYNLEEYPINIAGIFMDHINPTLAKGFHTNNPDFRKARPRAALTQRALLTDMLSTLIKTENNISNVLKIVSSVHGSEQFHMVPSPGGTAPAFPSVAKKTLIRYGGGGNESTKGGETTKGSFVERRCFGCNGPHPWSKKENGAYVVCCPNTNKPGVCKQAAAQIKDFQSRRGRKHSKGAKRRNLNMVNWEDIPSKRHEVLLQQHCSGSVVTTDSGSVTSSITGATGTCTSGHRPGNVTLHQDIVVLAGTSSKPPIPIAIHSPMAHITLWTGTSDKEKDSPNLHCVFDTEAALSTANFHFMEDVVSQYPHILKRIYLPAEYTSIVLSGIVTSTNDKPITMELSVGFEVHLPYLTKDSSETSLLVAVGPDVAVNLILDLPFIKATGMIGNFVNNVCQVKHLLCNPFPINFKCTTKSIPIFTYASAPCNVADSQDTLHVLAALRKFFPPKSNIIISTDTDAISAKAKTQFSDPWVPPASSDSSASSDANDYQHQVLGDLGYL